MWEQKFMVLYIMFSDLLTLSSHITLKQGYIQGLPNFILCKHHRVCFYKPNEPGWPLVGPLSCMSAIIDQITLWDSELWLNRKWGSEWDALWRKWPSKNSAPFLCISSLALSCILASYPFLGMGLSLGLCRSLDFSSTGTMLYLPESRVPPGAK